MVRELSKLVGKNAKELRALFLRDEEKDFRDKNLPINPGKGEQSRQGFLVRRSFWRGFARCFNQRKVQVMDDLFVDSRMKVRVQNALDKFYDRWESIIDNSKFGAAEYSALQYAGCGMHDGYSI